MQGSIQISALEVQCIVGCLPHERETPQKLVLHLDAHYDFLKVAQSDDLQDAVNYTALATLLEEFIIQERFHMLEALVVRACQYLLAQNPVLNTITLRAEKPAAWGKAHFCGASFTATR
jgi:7,8-dihydroneopterin aldolase/epimerase/oxygenase